MATFVLVHGAWLGGWCFQRVSRLLHRAGHKVYTPTLTGLGERAHLMSRAITLDTHVDDVLGVIRDEELSEIVLCGHSYGSAVISGVAEKAIDKIRSLVFLDAFVPENGQSYFDLIPAEHVTLMRNDALRNGEGYKLTPPPAERVGTNLSDIAWVNAMCVKHPLACFEQKLVLTGARDRVSRRTYIQATGYRSPFEAIAKRLDRDQAWQVKRIECGHLAMLDRPDEIADMLIQAV